MIILVIVSSLVLNVDSQSIENLCNSTKHVANSTHYKLCVNENLNLIKTFISDGSNSYIKSKQIDKANTKILRSPHSWYKRYKNIKNSSGNENYIQDYDYGDLVIDNDSSNFNDISSYPPRYPKYKGKKKKQCKKKKCKKRLSFSQKYDKLFSNFLYLRRNNQQGFDENKNKEQKLVIKNKSSNTNNINGYDSNDIIIDNESYNTNDISENDHLHYHEKLDEEKQRGNHNEKKDKHKNHKNKYSETNDFDEEKNNDKYKSKSENLHRNEDDKISQNINYYDTYNGSGFGILFATPLYIVT